MNKLNLEAENDEALHEQQNEEGEGSENEEEGSEKTNSDENVLDLEDMGGVLEKYRLARE